MLKACDAYDKMQSFTRDTFLNLTAYRESGEYPMYLYLSLVIDYGNLSDSNDDMLYEYSDTNGEVMHTWQKDNVLYIDDGYTRYQQDPVNEDLDYGYGKMLREIVNSAEEIEAEKSGTDTVYAITVNDKILDAYLNIFPAKRNSLTESKTGTKTYLTVDKDSNFVNAEFDLYMTWDGVDYMCLFDLTIEDINKSTIPGFDPEAFDGSEVEHNADKQILLDYDDLPVIVHLKYDESSSFGFQFYPADGEFDIVDDALTEVYYTGEILYSETTDQVITEIRNHRAEYEIHEERKLPFGTAVIASCETFVESFDRGTKVVVITFDGLDLGIIISGYGSINNLIKAFNELNIYTENR